MPNSLDIQIVSHATPDLVESLLDDLSGVTARVSVLENVREVRPVRREGVSLERHADGHPRGFAANHNYLASRGRGALIAILNPDLKVATASWAPLLAAFDDPSVGVVAPRVHEPDGRLADNARQVLTPARLMRDRLWPHRRRSDYPDATRRCEPDWVAGMFLIVRRSLFDRLGGFDTRYRMYCEDMDLCVRAWLAGARVCCLPCEGVVHDARRASLRHPAHLRWHLASLARFWRSPGYRDFLRSRSRRAGAAAGAGRHG
ncbi:MAG: glycosyltransferase [Rhodocyclaceae bacterium]|nr:glycosyltransferase [Rhodocyclaceae bacterium]